MWSGPLIALKSGRPELQSSGGLAGTGGSGSRKCLPIAGTQAVGAGGRPQFPHVGLLGRLSILRAWQMASSERPENQKSKDPIAEVTPVTPPHLLLDAPGKSSPHSRAKGQGPPPPFEGQCVRELRYT